DALLVGAFYDSSGEKDLKDVVKRLMRYSYLGVAHLAYDSSGDMIKSFEYTKLDLAYNNPYRQHDMLKVQAFFKLQGSHTRNEGKSANEGSQNTRSVIVDAAFSYGEAAGPKTPRHGGS
ncbi:hypothetical protein V500_10385, partial [Pseudogymnoascus sp. VKM F-4518 (FW-2643)]